MKKNTFKKFIIATLAGLMVFGTAPAASFARVDFSGLDFTSVRASAASLTSEDGMYQYEGSTITKVLKPDELPADYTVPSEIDGQRIYSIGGSAFSGCSNIINLIMPSITTVGESAFSGCTSLVSISMPKIVSLGNSAFRGCSSLSDFYLPDTLTTIGQYAFSDCNSITELTIPINVADIERYAFANCTSLQTVFFNATNCEIGDWTYTNIFQNCTCFKTIKFGKNVTEIPAGVCYNATNLEEVVFLGKVKKTMNASGNNNADHSQGGAFAFCTSLKSIALPDTFEIIGDSTFYGCSQLININLSKVKTINSNAFLGCSKLELIDISNVELIGRKAFEGCFNLLSPSFSNSLTTIGQFAFSGCESITQLTIPESVKSIGRFAFQSCSSLEQVSFNATSCEIGDLTYPQIYKNNSSLEKYIFGEKVKNIPKCACNGITTLKTIYFGTVIQSVGQAAFHDCKTNCEVYFPGTEEQWKAVTIASNNDNLANAKTYDTDMEYIWVHCEGVDEPDTPVTYTLTYDANGGSNAPASQTGNGAITLSTARPARDGYTFLGWAANSGATSAQYQPGASYSLTANVTLYAVWQKDEVPDTPDIPVNPTADAVININPSASVSYRSKVIIKATANNVPGGYYLAIYEGDTPLAIGDNQSVSYKTGEMTSGRTFTVKVIDGDRVVQKDSGNNELSRDCKVSVNSSFFARLIAFFQSLFGLLPETEIKP